MKRTHRGSMVLTSMFFISIIMLMMLLHWRSEESLQSIIIMRVKMMRADYACQAIMDYGINLCKDRYGFFATQRRQLTLTFNRWPLGNEEYGQGILEVTYEKKCTIMATLIKDNRALVRISCNLERQKALPSNIFTISGWKRHELQP